MSDDFFPNLDRGVGNGKPPEPSPEPLHVVNPASWEGQLVPERRWIVPDWVPSGFVTGLYGPPGLGKTLLLQQLITARATANPWIGCPVTRGRTIAFLCEDDEDELHRRQEAINEFYGCTYRDLDAWVRLVPRLGYDNVLMTFKDGRPELTPFYGQALEETLRFGADLAIIDTIADTFGGNQNDMAHARQMVQFGYGSFARAINGAVLASAHPSQSGKSSGSGESGSVQWDAAFRSRAYLDTPPVNGSAPPENARVLTRKKANYASRNEAIELTWKNGVLVPDRAPGGGIIGYIQRKAAKRVFLDILDKITAEGRNASENSHAPNYAPKLFAGRPDNEDYRFADFKRAMEDLFSEEVLRNQPYKGRNGRTGEHIVRAEEAA